MMLKSYFCALKVLVLCLNHVNGLCPYARHTNDITNSVETVAEDYMSSISFETYQTNCHWFVSQPPAIPSTIVEHALTTAFNQTVRYATLDIEAAAGVCPARRLTDLDRINYFFESATRYVQENTCSSKQTTTFFLPTLQLDNFANLLNFSVTPVVCNPNENVTPVMCEGGHISYPNCTDKSSVRQVDGTCNNLERPLDGSVGDCQLRLLAPDYKDGINVLRYAADGTPLPNPKVLSDALFAGAEDRPFSNTFSQLQALFGEFVIGDNGMTLNHDTAMLFKLQCCDSDDRARVDHPQCAPFFTPPEQNSYSYTELRSADYHANAKCMRFVRSLPCIGCKFGPRMISSSVPATQDLNSVYGVSDEMLAARRTFRGGCLKSQTVNGEELFAVERINATGRFRCFEGECEVSPMDIRNVLAPTGLVFALLFHRNHNRHARNLAAAQPKWNDEEIFQTARRWNIAEYQHCVYNEYLETLIGENLMQHFAIHPQPLGEFSYYEEDVSAKTILEFQSTAGRQGHTTLIEDVPIIDPKTMQEYSLSLSDRDTFERIFYEGLVDEVLFAQLQKPAFQPTPSIPFKTFVLVSPNIDLAALDIQRQRDHGIPGYIYYLQYFNDVVVERWDDLLQFIDTENIEKLKEHYKYVEDIELYVGGHHERKVYGAITGPTFAHIIALQFHHTKYGDRFFYEHADQVGSFSIEQLNEIKTKCSFAYILCKNTNLDYVSRDPFRVLSYDNPLVPCSEFDDIDYKLPVVIPDHHKGSKL